MRHGAERPGYNMATFLQNARKHFITAPKCDMVRLVSSTYDLIYICNYRLSAISCYIPSCYNDSRLHKDKAWF